jgi:putative tryptophan/tyrosine transport system substrate-binding protein
LNKLSPMRRRDFIIFFGGFASAWPAVVRAQKLGDVRRIGVLMNLAADDPQGQERAAAFRQALKDRGWSEGRNVSIDVRWAAGDRVRAREYAAELVALAPDVILAGSGLVVRPLQEATRTVPIPIVFTAANDPVRDGLIASLARPGGNTTGFINIEDSFSAKWLELLNQIAPTVTRAGVLRDPGFRVHIAPMEAVAPSLRVELIPIDMHDGRQIERAIADFAAEPNGGLIVTMSTRAAMHRDLIIALAARHRLPAVYPLRFHVVAGGLISYGPIFLDQYRHAADYVDRILNGAKPADLPVQAPDRYEMVLNLMAAKGLGLSVSSIPRIVLGRVDEFIETK